MPYLQSPLRRYVVYPFCPVTSLPLLLLSLSPFLSSPRLALDSVSRPDPCSSSCTSGKAVLPCQCWAMAVPWGAGPSSAFPPVPCPPHRPVPGCSLVPVLMKLCVCARHCRLRLYLPLQPRDQEARPCSYHLLGKPCGSLGFNRLDDPQRQGQAPILGRNIALASGGIARHEPATSALPPVQRAL